MRLNHKFTLAYSIISFFVLLIGIGINYVAVNRSAEQATIAVLKNLNTTIVRDIEKNGNYNAYRNNNFVKITVLDTVKKIPDERVENDYRWTNLLKSTLNIVQYTTVYKINNTHYEITTKAPIIKPKDQYITGLAMVFAWTFVFLITLVIVLSQIISIYILDPFQKTLLAISNFQISDNDDVVLEKSTTYEFNRLNSFIESTLKRSRRDYFSLKEFSENASHELQTPVAVMQAKIDLLLQTDLTEQQLHDVIKISEELVRLSSVQKSLTLLTKLDHFTITDNEINLSNYLKKSLGRFTDIIDLNDLELTTAIDDDVFVVIDDVLIKILHNNIITNAIRHNIPNGTIKVTLNTDYLLVENTGNPPNIAPEKVFDRFQKGNSQKTSSGIGLSIVKKIIDLYGYSVAYYYENGIHSFKIRFKKA